MYSNGESERIIGKALKIYNIPREKVVILTKLHNVVAEDVGLSQMQYHKEIGVSKDYVNHFGECFLFSVRRLVTCYSLQSRAVSCGNFQPGRGVAEASRD